MSAKLLTAALAPRAYQIAAGYPPVVSPRQFSEILGLSRKTVYQWLAQGRLRGAARKRGKHVLILLDAALTLVFEGEEWGPPPPTSPDKK